MVLSRLTRRAAIASGLALASAPAAKARPGPQALKVAAARRGVLFGAAVEPHQLDADRAYATLIREQCAVLTPENAMKWDALRPTRDTFDFARADRLMQQAKTQGAGVHGHCLVWHETVPAWVPKSPTRAEALSLLREHILRVVGRYAGAIRSWDVVNEAVERNDRRPDGLRRSYWLRAIGPDYLAQSFEAARAADPRARLTLSDYGLEYDDISWMVEKRGTMLALLKALKTRGTPIHALGIQGHLLGDRPPAFGRGLRTFLRQVVDLGLEVYVTELDVNDQSMPGSVAQRDRSAARIYGAFLETVLQEPGVRMVSTWGLSDRYTSKREFFPRADGDDVRPLPFDRDLQPKPVVGAMLAALS